MLNIDRTQTEALPPRDVMLDAFLGRDSSYDGVFVTGVQTTGIFCRPTCTARKPLPENVDFFSTPRDALQAGFRPCKRCRPMEPRGTPPDWLRPLLERIEGEPARRWTDEDLRGMALSPSRVRRWFQKHHGMTFHAYSRARRLGEALGHMQEGKNVSRAAFSTGYESLSAFYDAFRELLGAPPGEAKSATRVTLSRFLTPLGPMLAGATDEALCLLEYVDRRMLESQLQRLGKRLGCVFIPGSNPMLDRTAAEMEAYFAGDLEEFGVPLHSPGTEFQKKVWAALREIPYGTTTSYGELARRIGKPKAVRAVARANGDNRIAIILPCHRVVGSDGSLTGYGGGLWRKKKLLELESRQLSLLPQS